MRFFKYGISIFDGRPKELGGFNHFIAAKIFRWKLHYLDISLTSEFKFKVVHNSDDHYYDGYQNYIWIGWIIVSYAT